MNRLQQLISEKLVDGKSYRRIAEECGLNHNSISQYHNDGKLPKGKNLAVLAKYFNVEFFDLVEKAPIPGEVVDGRTETSPPLSIELRLIVAELEGLSPTAQLEWLLKIRKEKEAASQE